MKRTPADLIMSVALALALGLGTYATAAAQKPTHPRAPSHMRSGNESPSTAPDRVKDHDPFRGIAKKLGTTADNLEMAYQTAKQTNSDLTRGQFIAAHVLAQNLGEKYPNITVAAILMGLQNHQSIGKTLHSLGLGDKEAKEAEARADREAREAERDADQAAKTPS